MSNPRTVPGSLPHLRLAHLLSPYLPRPAGSQGGQARGCCDLHKQPWGAGLETCNLKRPVREAGGWLRVQGQTTDSGTLPQNIYSLTHD